jgi:hypothetical protein
MLLLLSFGPVGESMVCILFYELAAAAINGGEEKMHLLLSSKLIQL